MNTFAIAEAALRGYINERLPKERIDFLITQANEQLNEISQNKEIYNSFLKQVNAPQKIDNLVLWILLMSNEEICSEYISEFDKDFEDEIPVFDLSDLLFYVVYLTKVKKIKLDGFNYLLEYKTEGIDEVDQCSFTNAFLYIQKSKEVKIDF
jgi:hypothetical protein